MTGKTRLLDIELPWVKINQQEIKPVNCLLCKPHDSKLIGSIIINKNEFYLANCEKDDLFWMNPQPGKTFLNTLYSAPYYEIEKYGEEMFLQVGTRKIKEDDKERRIEIARKQIQEWNDLRISSIGGRKKLLEIGGKKSYIQETATLEGWETTNIEASSYNIEEGIKNGLNILSKSVEEIRRVELNYFDLAVIYDFIEHTQNPTRIIRLIKKSLKDNGYLIVRAPDTNKEIPKLHLVDHLWHFSQGALEKLLQREGFEILKSFESGIFSPDTTSNKIIHKTFFTRKCK